MYLQTGLTVVLKFIVVRKDVGYKCSLGNYGTDPVNPRNPEECIVFLPKGWQDIEGLSDREDSIKEIQTGLIYNPAESEIEIFLNSGD